MGIMQGFRLCEFIVITWTLCVLAFEGNSPCSFIVHAPKYAPRQLQRELVTYETYFPRFPTYFLLAPVLPEMSVWRGFAYRSSDLWISLDMETCVYIYVYV